MTRSREGRQDRVAEPQRLILEQKLIHAGDYAFSTSAIHDLRSGSLFNERCPSNVVGMDVRFNGEEKGEPKLFGNSEVALDIFDDGIMMMAWPELRLATM
jgi:hypothetical protein